MQGVGEKIKKEKIKGGDGLGDISMYSIQWQVSKFSKTLRGNCVTVVETSLMTAGAEKLA